MIFVTGDTHADWLTRLSFRAFPEGRDLTKQNFVLVLGDFGIWELWEATQQVVNHALNHRSQFIDKEASNPRIQRLWQRRQRLPLGLLAQRFELVRIGVEEALSSPIH